MKNVSHTSLKLFFCLSIGCSWLARITAAPTEQACENWAVYPKDKSNWVDPAKSGQQPWVDQVKDVELARTGEGGDDIKEAIALLVAYVEQPTFNDFLSTLIGSELKVSTCDTSNEGAKFKFNVFNLEADGDRNMIEKEMILKGSDLGFAAGDRANIAIWPMIVFKALDAILADKNFEKSKEQPTLLRNQDAQAELYHCSDGRKYLCYASDLITRLTGIELESTQRIMDDTQSHQVSITDLFNAASSGPTIVFKNKALNYIVRGIDGEADGDNTFKALWLDMHKSGESGGDDEMHYRIDSFEERSGIKFKEIKGQHQQGPNRHEHADIHIVHPFNEERKSKNS